MTAPSKRPLAAKATGGSPGRVSSLLLGWWGCADAVHSAAWTRKTPGARPPTRTIVRCPGCDPEHLVNLMWREARDGEGGDVEIEMAMPVPAERPFSPSLPKHGVFGGRSR